MWTLIVLVLTTLPPQGIAVRGFPDKAACEAEAKWFCGDEPGWRCKCITATPDRGET